MHLHVLLHCTLAFLCGTSAAAVYPEYEPREFPLVNSTRVVDDTTIYFPGPVDLRRRVRSAPTSVNLIGPSFPKTTDISAENITSGTTEDNCHEGSVNNILSRTGQQEKSREGTPPSKGSPNKDQRAADAHAIKPLIPFGVACVLILSFMNGIFLWSFRRARRKEEEANNNGIGQVGKI